MLSGSCPLPRDGFSLNLVSKYFSKICWGDSSLIRMTRTTNTSLEDVNTFTCLILLLLLLLLLLQALQLHILKVLAFSTTSLHLPRSWTQSVQFFIFILQISCLTLSSHLLLGIPCNLVVTGFHLYLFLTILLSDILCTWLGPILGHRIQTMPHIVSAD